MSYSAPQGKNVVCVQFEVFNILSYKGFCTYCVFTLSNNNVKLTCICKQTNGVYAN